MISGGCLGLAPLELVRGPLITRESVSELDGAHRVWNHCDESGRIKVLTFCA